MKYDISLDGNPVPLADKDKAPHKTHFLHAGMLFCPDQPHLVTTLLGSCVSVCLWDPELQVGGINHYLVPFWNGEGLPSPRYGNVAIRKLLEKMYALGCRKTSLVAKVFGGASLMASQSLLTNVGDRNVHLALDMLKAENIPVRSSDLGGKQGRKIIFDTAHGAVRRLKRLNQLQAKHPAWPTGFGTKK
jgi:chemotaxis protein CheD